MLQPGKNCWAVARADHFSVIVDAEDYFLLLRELLLNARKRIILVGWDFDARIGFHCAERFPGEPEAIGDFILWLANRTPDLEIYLLRWDIGALKALFRGSTPITALRWAMHPRIHVKLDGHHPTGSSHHQKLVSVDDNYAVCGGIDMTADRWDTREHLTDDPRRCEPNGKPYAPWHDATTAMTGPIACVIAQECRDRWLRATGTQLPAIAGDDAYEPKLPGFHLSDVEVGVARSHPEMDEQEPAREIEQLFLDQIAAARSCIYLESQYFASRRIAEAISRRLAEPDGPEIVLINPSTADGWLEHVAMDKARARIVAALHKVDTGGRFALYHPVTSEGEDIYVHAKIAIIDDIMVRVGSANLNNRSMRLDTECDVCIDASINEGAREREWIASIRDDLLAEHLGVTPSQVASSIERTGSVIAAIEALRGTGRTLRPYKFPEVNDLEKWLADNEILDPENPDDMFEPVARRSLFARLRKPW